MSAVDRRLTELGRLCREVRARRPTVDMSPPAVERRLRRVSQLRALCVYLGEMSPAASPSRAADGPGRR